jgi:DNA-binding PadR family transcriptional regulator
MNRPKILSRDSRKRKIGIPRGLLLHISLDIFKKKPTSGSELMDEIEYYTEWRPSPGSIYPLISKLCGHGLIELVDSDDPSVKRYTLTKEGIKKIKEHNEQGPNFESRFHSIQKIYWMLFKGINKDLFRALSKLLETLENGYPLIMNDSVSSLKVREKLLETAERIEKIYKKLENKK